jgi:hypothetical protein
MNANKLKSLPKFLEILGLDEEPKDWATVQKKIARSKKAWGENP